MKNSNLPPISGGKCTLVGAGPGDPELLTIKAVKAIQAATVLLVDDLVNDEIVAAYATKINLMTQKMMLFWN